jgi:hypothetical protein
MKSFVILFACCVAITSACAQTAKKTKSKSATAGPKAVTKTVVASEPIKKPKTPYKPVIRYADSSTVVVRGSVFNCLHDPIPAIMVTLYDSGNSVLTQTLTDMMGMYSFTASRSSVFGLQISTDGDSSQIVTGLRASRDQGIFVDFIARNLPERFLFPTLSVHPVDMRLDEAGKAKRAELKRMLNGDASLIAATKPGLSVSTDKQLLLSSINNGAVGIYYEVTDQSSNFAELDGSIPAFKEGEMPAMPDTPMPPTR